MTPIRTVRSETSIASRMNRSGVVDRAGRRIVLGLLAAAMAAATDTGCGRQEGEGVGRVSSALSSDPSGVTLLPACVAKTSATEWWATFGYESATAQTVVVAASASNGFQPTPVDRGQPTRFDPGLHAHAFSVRFDGNALTWKLGTRTVTATSSSPSCVSPGASATAPVLAQFALYAQADIRIDRAVVMGGDVGVALTNAMTDGRDEVSLEPSGRLDPTRGVFAHTVDLRSQAVMGTVYTTRLDNQGGSFVAVKPFPTVMPSIRALMPIVPGTTAINVASGTTMALQPGAYGAVQVNGTLTLSGGTYQIASLEIGTAGRVEATSGVQLRIQGHLHLGPSAHLRTNPVGSARDLLVEVAGNDGTTAVIVDSDTELHALVYRPTGTLVFHPRTSARGAFVAHDMQVNADALVVYESGFALPLKTCIAQFQISPDKVVPGKDPQDLAHTIAATACLAPDASNCEVAFWPRRTSIGGRRPSNWWSG